jgi:predicted unusual protein kinase regulating ubiquinone biosynthesis (AarF/ABC1/UbiB family)
VPEIIEELCSKRVLTMEYIEGIKITDALSIKETLGVDPVQCGRMLSSLFSKMIF